MRDEIKEEVERQLAERDAARRRRSRRVFAFAMLPLVLLVGLAAWAQQTGPGFGGQHQMADLFKVFFTWDATTLYTTGSRGINPGASTLNVSAGCVGGGGSDQLCFVPNSASMTSPGGFHFTAGTTVDNDRASGSNAYAILTNGARNDLGTGSNDYFASDGTNIIAGTSPGAGYIASAIPVVLSELYVNGLIATITYGGVVLPAHPFTVTDLSYYVRTSGTCPGIKSVTFRITDGTNTCDCSWNGDEATGQHTPSGLCSGTGGSGCAFPASASISYAFNAVGSSCAPTQDIAGNISVRGKWQ